MTDKPFTQDEEAQLYNELGLSLSPMPDPLRAMHEKVTKMKDMFADDDVATDERPNPASAVVVQVPDVKEVEFDDALIEHLDLNDGQQRAEASRILFAEYGAAALGIPKGTHRSNWNSLIHTRISMHLGRKVTATRQQGQETLRRKVKETSAEKVADTAALSTQAALKVLKDQILDEDGNIDLARFAELLKEA